MTPRLTFILSYLITLCLESITYVSDDKKVKSEILTLLFTPEYESEKQTSRSRLILHCSKLLLLACSFSSSWTYSPLSFSPHLFNIYVFLLLVGGGKQRDKHGAKVSTVGNGTSCSGGQLHDGPSADFT